MTCKKCLPYKNSDTLRLAYLSTQYLYERFGTKPTISEAQACFKEEVEEFTDEIERFISRELIADEAADVIITVTGLCSACDISMIELLSAMRGAIEKNDAKTHQTHHLNEHGKIARWE